MLSFEISAIDVVLLVAMLTLALLFVTQRRNQPVAVSRLKTHLQEELSEEPRTTEATTAGNHVDKQAVEGFKGCIHQFGHLRKMPKNTSIPDECFGCPKVMRCMFKSE